VSCQVSYPAANPTIIKKKYLRLKPAKPLFSGTLIAYAPSAPANGFLYKIKLEYWKRGEHYGL